MENMFFGRNAKGQPAPVSVEPCSMDLARRPCSRNYQTGVNPAPAVCVEVLKSKSEIKKEHDAISDTTGRSMS